MLACHADEAMRVRTGTKSKIFDLLACSQKCNSVVEEVCAVSKQLAFFRCVKNSAQEKLSKMTIMSKNSVFRDICNFEALLYKVDFISDHLKCKAAQV